MKNDKFRENIIHYIKDELESHDKGMFETELAKNSSLAKEFNDVKSSLDIISKYPEEEAPQGFLLNLKAKISELSQDKTPKQEIKKKARFYANITFYVKFAAATILLFVLIFVLTNNLQSTKQPMSSPIIGKVASMGGVVLVQNSKDAYPKRIVNNENLKDNQIIKTGHNSFVNLIFQSNSGKNDYLYLQENTEIQICGTQMEEMKNSNFKLQNIKLIEGSVYVDVVSRTNQNSNSEGADQQNEAPFFVKTPNIEARVRGTKFKVDYNTNDRISEVFVSKGRVDVFSNTHIDNFERVEEGYFCVVGDTSALKNKYPGLKNLENTDESFVTRPLLDIRAEVIENKSIRIVLLNNFYNTLRLSYYENRDNIGIRYEFPSDDSVSLNWSPVRRLLADLEPGETRSFKYSIPEILRSEIAGDYYLQAVYSGNLEIPNFPPFNENTEKIASWRMLNSQLYSNRVAIVLNGK